MTAPAQKCPFCGNALGPATLNPEHLWCSICAVELDAEGKPLEPTLRQNVDPPAGGDVVRPPKTAPGMDATPTKSFTVTIDNVSFSAIGRVELTIAGTKVTVT